MPLPNFNIHPIIIYYSLDYLIGHLMAQKKILIVDDEVKVCDILKAYLEKEGYEVIVATDGKSAVEKAQKANPDLILLDLNLPEINDWMFAV